jgi:hypothetical protein
VWTSSKELDEAEMREVSFEPDLPLPIQNQPTEKRRDRSPAPRKLTSAQLTISRTIKAGMKRQKLYAYAQMATAIEGCSRWRETP